MTKPLCALLALLALVPTAASAQAGAALGAPAPATYGARLEAVEVPEPPQTIALDPEIAQLRAGASGEADAPTSDGPSLGASWGHAWAGFGIGTAGGALLGGAITMGITCSNDSGGFCVLFGLLGAGFGAATLAPLGAALGTWGFGETHGGTGNFFAALGGSYLGAGLGVGISGLLGAAGLGAYSFIGAIAGVLLSTFGAAAGYQLSSHGGRAEGSSGVAVAPTFDVNENGGSVGVAGMF
ncbi:MAG: hypothetical protein KC619_01205 [Myxococcales bacterium]|nr:hypothetical protein [Myxococcales bacterium]